jgi:hypothetical protein
MLQKVILDKNDSQIIFITHSEGGLVTTQALLDYPALANNVSLIFYYGTPFKGSIFAEIIGNIFDNADLHAMSLKSIYLRGLLNRLRNDRSDNGNKKFPKKIACAYEGKSTAFGLRVSDYESATLLCNDPNSIHAIDADHINMVKPKDTAALSFQALAFEVKDIPFPSNGVAQLNSEGATGSNGQLHVNVSYPIIKRVQLSITTNSGNKGPSTWLSAQLICDGRTIADYLDKGSLLRQQSTDPLQFIIKEQQQIDPNKTKCDLTIELSNSGRKFWDFDSFLELNLSDGTARTYYLNWKLGKTIYRDTQPLSIKIK